MAHIAQSEAFFSQVNILTATGNYLTVLNNGGFDGDGTFSISTNRTHAGVYEMFTFIPLDPANATFALQTFGGYFITAIDGGGIAGPGGIDTDRNTPKAWELIVMEKQSLGQFSLRTSSGHYVTAVNGGGVGGPGAINTNRNIVGPWEAFTFRIAQP